MSYQEKKTIANTVTGLAVLAAYCINALNKYHAGVIDPGDLKSWAITMLVFVGIGIAAVIVINIVFHIILAVVGEVKREKMIDEGEDEMDKLISLKSMRVGYFIAGVGLMAALITLAFSCPAALMLNIIFLSFGVASLAECFVGIYFYRKGFRNA